MTNFKERFEAFRARLERAAAACGRDPGEIAVLAVGKRHPASAIRDLAALGQHAFGENYVAEALEKIAALSGLDLEWHYVGPVQSNKTAAIASHFDWVQSVDREKILNRLSAQRPAGTTPLQCCLQVKIGHEETKSGAAPDEIPALARLASELAGLRLRGLMAIPPPSEDRAVQRRYFAELRHLFERLNAEGFGLDTLSMGMSGDLEAAVAEGTTMVRVGTALFGPRPPA